MDSRPWRQQRGQEAPRGEHPSRIQSNRRHDSRRTPRLPSPAMPRKPKPDESKEEDKLKQPSDYVAAGKKWPAGPLVDNAPKEAHLAQGIAVKILDQIEKNNTTRHAVAKLRGIDAQTLYNVLDGKSWPNFVTVARLEIHFNRRLWGNEHKPRRASPATEP